MAVSLSSTLAAHQKSNRRRPALAVTASALRFGVEHPRWTRYYTGAEADGPSAVVVAADGSLVRARNNAGSLDYMRVFAPDAYSTYSTWTTIVAVTAGNAIALASKASELLLAYVDNAGLTIKVRTSADNGLSWSAATLIVTEGAAIVGMAAAYRPNGDALLLYCVGTDVKRLRRTAGVWAGAGTAWSRAGSVATLTGVATAHDGSDFSTIVTGTAVTSTNPTVWGAIFGDGGVVVSNNWSGLAVITDADALSTTTFAGPAAIMLGLIPTASYRHKETGNVAFDRAYTAHTDITGLPTGTWTEPAPHEASSASGMSMAQGNGVRTNLFGNGGFETNTTGWITNGAGVTIARTTTTHQYGAAAVQVSVVNANYGQGLKTSGGFTLINGQSYTFSLWCWTLSGTLDLQLFVDDGIAT
ncbi:MAG: carbohydrate binding domain-containing protein, partial [Anaerolineaceae bacterium]